MQETDFYQHLLALPDLRVTGVAYQPNRITLFCQPTAPQQACPHCLKPTAQIHQYTTRQVRDLDISGRQVYLQIQLRQFVCPDCNRYFNESLAFADSAKSYTHRQAKWIVECCARQPFTAVAALLDMNPKTVERSYYHHCQQHLNLPARYATVKGLGIDEIAHRKGKNHYCCVLTDLDKGIVLDILPTRSKEALVAHFQKLGPAFCQQIESVSFDMWPAYYQLSRTCFPQAVLVIDRFHVVKLLNEVLDRFRRKLRREFPWKLAFKSIKWALFKSRPTAAEQTQLAAACKQSPRLATLLALRNRFHRYFETAQTESALAQSLQTWLGEAKTSGCSQLASFIGTLERWLAPIANYAHQRLTNAATEGLNNLIRYVKRISFGLPNFEHLRLRVLTFAI